MQLPFIAALLVAGIITGIAFPGKLTGAFGTATLYIFLPALIFEGAWRLDARIMGRAWAPIALLAVPGVIFTAAIIAVCVHYAGNFPWTSALLLGAILSATDPVAVLAIFRRLPLPRALTTIVQSEALLNDAAAVVLYRAILVTAALAATANLWQVAWHALLGSFLGVAAGAAIAYATVLLLGRTTNAAIYIAATLTAAYGSYYLANRFDWSGIFAVLSFGIVFRLLQSQRITAPCARSVGSVWDGIAWVANAALFFLIGAALDLARLGHALPIALLTVLAVFLARFVIVYGLLHLARPRLHLSWMAVVRMAGIRGALSLALALATPLAFAQRELIVDATFVVVVVTVLLGSLTLDRRMARLPLHGG